MGFVSVYDFKQLLSHPTKQIITIIHIISFSTILIACILNRNYPLTGLPKPCLHSLPERVKLNYFITMVGISRHAAIVRPWNFYTVSHCIRARPIVSRKCFIIGLPGWYKIAILITLLNSLPLTWRRRAHDIGQGHFLMLITILTKTKHYVPVFAIFWCYAESTLSKMM